MLAHVLHRGDVFAGRYRVERCIGSGGMGAVFEAEHVDTERRVALKVLLPQALVSESARERFKQEARVAGKLRNPNIVEVLDAGVDDVTAMPYLVMELLQGEDLGSRIARRGKMDPHEATALLAQIASALDCLHDKQIVHRDLKPENLFLMWAEDGTKVVKLLDFGVAKVIADGKTSALTQDAQGTPVYMAPEQFAEQIRISPATDIYALGMLAFTFLTGRQYWGTEIERGMNVFMLARVAEAGPKEPATHRASRGGVTLPLAFDEWFATVTAIVPGERYPTATDAIDALADVLGVDLRAEPARWMRPSPVPEAPPSAPRSERLLSPTSGLQSTPPIPLRSPRGFWRPPRIIAAALLAVGAALVIAVALRAPRPVTSGSSPSGPPSPSDTPAGTLSALPSAPPSSAPPLASSSDIPTTPPLAPSDVPATSTSPSSTPTASSSSPQRPEPYRPPPRVPASSTTTRKPKYTRD